MSLGVYSMDNRVALVKCANYEQSNVDDAVRSAFDLLGGVQNFVKKGQTVVLKVNLVSRATPDNATTTHPSVVEAVGKLVQSLGARVVIADSGGCAYTEAAMSGIYKSSGMTDVAIRNGFELNSDYGVALAEYQDASVGKKFEVLSVLENADVIINLCKLKTHSFTGLTNAVKNMFGAIPGLTKVEMHGKYRTLAVFGNFLYDILGYLGDKIALNISDAIMAMEGPGPTSGTPRFVGAIIASTNPAACDVVGARLMSLDPRALPNINTGIERGWLDNDCSVDILGANINDLIVKDFVTVMPNEFKPFSDKVPRWLQPAVHRMTTRRPVVNRRKCKGCKKCFEHCPVKAITMVPTKKGGIPKAKFDYSKCIRCFCCQELCPFQLVKVRSGIVYKILHRKDGTKVNKQKETSSKNSVSNE